MKCLSVRQPFAWAILKGIKRIENRSRFPDFHGPVLIHTGKVAEKLEGRFPDGTPVPRLQDLPLGAIVGAAVVVAHWSVAFLDAVVAGDAKIRSRGNETLIEWGEVRASMPRDDGFKADIIKLANDPFTNGPICILLDLPVEFEKPIPFSGQVGLFNVDEKQLNLRANDVRQLAKVVKVARMLDE